MSGEPCKSSRGRIAEWFGQGLCCSRVPARPSLVLQVVGTCFLTCAMGTIVVSATQGGEGTAEKTVGHWAQTAQVVLSEVMVSSFDVCSFGCKH